MQSSKIRLFNDSAIESTLTPYLRDGEICPAMLVVPGGGYCNVCERTEGEPIARRFNELGFHAFVLEYRVAPHHFPAPLHDGMRAVQLIRRNAAAWGVIADRIAACGFSAGGHLCAMLGTIVHKITDFDGSPEECAVNGLVLSYALLSMQEPLGHNECQHNLFGDSISAEKKRLCTPYLQVTDKTPPAYVWHTFGDTVLNYFTPMEFARAMVERGRPCELHIYPMGDHGMQLGLNCDVESWTAEAAGFLNTQWAIRDGKSQKILERYDYMYQCRLSEARYIRS